jgi:hypothetical protein
MIPHHTVNVTRLDRGFVITNPESIAMDCDEPWHDSWVVDVSDRLTPGCSPVCRDRRRPARTIGY